MKILVCISFVPETTAQINFTKNNSEFQKESVHFILNPQDEYTLSCALHLKKKQESEITVIHVGTSKSENVLRKTLAMGADAAVRIAAEKTDAFFVANQIANFAKQEKFDLIFTGKESIDYNGNRVGGMLAGILDIDFINNCVGLEMKNKMAFLKRETKNGTQEITAQFPLIIAGQKGLVAPKDLIIPNMKGIMMARKKQIKVLKATENFRATKTLFFEKIEKKKNCQMIDSQNIDEFIEILQKDLKLI